MNISDLLVLQFSPYFAVPVAAVIGLVLGSFYNVCIYRYVAEVPMNKPRRSFCPACSHTLSWFENIPLISYWVLGGRCRHCGARISPRYALVEFVSMAWAAALAFKMGLSLPWLVFMVFGGLFIVGSFIDFAIYILPDRVTIGGTVLALVIKGLFGWAALKTALLGALLGGGIFWLLQQVYRIVRKEEGLGTGDVKLLFCIGALVGPLGLPFTVLSASITALVASVVYMRLPESRGMRTRIPFGPFLCLGAMLQILVGREVLAWYLTFY